MVQSGDARGVSVAEYEGEEGRKRGLTSSPHDSLRGGLERGAIGVFGEGGEHGLVGIDVCVMRGRRERKKMSKRDARRDRKSRRMFEEGTHGLRKSKHGFQRRREAVKNRRNEERRASDSRSVLCLIFPSCDTAVDTSAGGGVLTIADVTIWTIYLGSLAGSMGSLALVWKAAVAAQWTSPERNEMRTFCSSEMRWHCSTSQLRSSLWSMAVQWSERLETEKKERGQERGRNQMG
jgi:hypothetical protein